MLHRVLWNCYELTRNQWLSPSKLRKLQENRLHSILKHAYADVPFYQKKFDSVGIKPADIQTVEDLVKLPFTTKQEIKQNLPDQCIANGSNLDNYVRWGTSGTTGGPMPVYYNKRFYDYVIAERHYRIFRTIGCNPWDKMMLIKFHMPEPASERQQEPPRMSRGQTALGSAALIFKRWQKSAFIAYNADEIIHDLIDYQPKILKGSASYLRLVAEAFTDKGIKDIHLKAAVSIGELMDEPTRQFLESTFGCPVFNVYGAGEVGDIARECPRKEGLHEQSDFVIVEVIQNGEPAAPGELGDIVVTGLLNYAMPMIRYRVGDVGILTDRLCSCGRGSPLLQSVEGRLVDCFVLPDGSTVSPRAIMTAVQGTPGVSRYRVVQESRDKVIVELMRRPTDPDVAIDELIERCHALLGDEVEVEVVFGGRDNLRAKFRPVISKLTIDSEPRWTEPYQIIRSELSELA